MSLCLALAGLLWLQYEHEGHMDDQVHVLLLEKLDEAISKWAKVWPALVRQGMPT